MCLLCVEVAKQSIKPKDFWNNFREIIGTPHEKEVIKAIKQTPEEFQNELTKHALVIE